ncbi:MAG TPA: hypothetical protein ENH10_07125 [Bacteroidetes bacterium]|nr:hypothetical protein [Bacteroidota bacterium]HEX04913.1 hypothetical protein [Bacteroidota bacterium]
MADENQELVRLLVALTLKEQQYVELRATGLSKAASARGAGYTSEKEGKRLEKKVVIQRALAAARADAVQTMRISRDDVLRGFMDAVRASDSATELIQAWREIGRMLGHYEPEKKVMEVNQTTTKNIRLLRSLPESKLAELAGIDPQLLLEGIFEEVPEGEAKKEEADADSEE